ncbi:MAG: hypothetical protein EBR02_04775 [Alphaproteobacteria bacterium]|nr:hypothetical protein [Alphaproteobacteria bacterium]
MTGFQNVLSALCTKIELKNASDFQSVFAIADEKEARLAYDVLTAYNFECKVYAEDGASKLYITNPAATDATVSARLAAALAYAHSLKTIKSALDHLCQTAVVPLHSPDYNLSFVNLPASGGKQLLINVIPATSQTTNALTPQPAASSTPQPAKTVQSAATPMPKTSKYMRRTQEETMFSGPSLLSDNNKIISNKDKQKQEEDTAWRRFSLYIKGNSAVAFSIIVVVLIVLLSLFSLAVVSKGFLCPDLAHSKKKNTAWYCQEPEKEKAQEEPQ